MVQKTKNRPVPLAIIGGGAAGLMAAAAAKARGVGCVVVERKARIGSKMLMTANGRCNFTKDVSAERMLADIGEPVASFARAALSACPPSMIAAGFKARGLRVKRMVDGRLFPASEKAADVVHVFGDMLRDEEIPLLTNCAVTGIVPRESCFVPRDSCLSSYGGGESVGERHEARSTNHESRGFVVETRDFSLLADNVLIATGGLSFPKTGSVGDGQNFARSLGHSIVPYRAGLTGFELGERGAARPMRYERAVASILAGGDVLCRYEGEVEFERWGVSGAAVYNCQRIVARNNLRDFVLRLELPGSRMLEFRSPNARPLKECIVTMGGVALDEVDPRTMQSRIVPGLYFAGEVLDIDGPTGGYNLSLAFATARLAVSSIKV